MVSDLVATRDHYMLQLVVGAIDNQQLVLLLSGHSVSGEEVFVCLHTQRLSLSVSGAVVLRKAFTVQKFEI